jgi:guanylate kinase
MPYEHKPYLLILIAPSGGGKSTLCRAVLQQEDNFEYSVSSTTREPRGEEKNGEAYFFLSEAEFLAARERGEFIESAQVHGSWYGTSSSFISSRLEKGKNIVLDIDVQGALQILESGIECVTVFLLPPTEAELKKRLQNRGTETEEKINLRLRNAQSEIAQIDKFDYLVINDKLEDALSDLMMIIRAEKLRVNRYVEIEEKYYRRKNA